MILPRTRQNQKRLFYFQKYEKEVSLSLLEQLFVYSGSIFFNNKQEQSEYLSFVGYCPNPRTESEEKHFENRLISKNGYVPRENRLIVFGSRQNKSKFESDPSNLILKLAEIRNFKYIPESAHHLKIFKEVQKPFN